jgi:hypothetical protein
MPTYEEFGGSTKSGDTIPIPQNCYPKAIPEHFHLKIFRD